MDERNHNQSGKPANVDKGAIPTRDTGVDDVAPPKGPAKAGESRAGRVVRRIRDYPEGPAAQSRPTARKVGDDHSPGAARPRPSAQKPEERRISPWAWVFLAGVVVALVLGQWTLLVAILGLAFLITVHEFGHFLAAKLFGMRVERFYVGFPPALWKRSRGETEYGIGVIPLGGFCKISGMSTEEELPAEVESRAYYNQPVWKRNIVIAAGPFMNIFAAAVIMFAFVMIQGVSTPTLRIAEIAADSPAAEVGLAVGDRLVGGRTVATDNGGAGAYVRFDSWDDATAFFRAHPEQRVELTIVPRSAAGSDSAGSSGEAAGSPTETVAVRLSRSPQDDTVGYLGVGSTVVSERPAPWTAVWLGIKDAGLIVANTFKGFWWLIDGRVSATSDQGVTGPVGIVRISSEAVQQNWYPVLLAFISVNLGILNLIPILPFDGGHIFFNTLESIRGRRTSPVVLERAATVGVLLLLMLFVFVTFNDLRHLFS